MTDWVVPGYDALELLGFGASGELWRARERSSGGLVALRRIVGGDREAVARVRHDATVVRSLPSPHLVRLRTVIGAGKDDVLVLDHADGGSLPALLSRRRALDPGEVVTALAPLAEALGQAHAHGLVHGRVTVASVLLSADGRPLLDGLGLSCLVDAHDSYDPTGALGASADVWALGALAHLLLTGREAEPGVPLAPLAPTAPVPLVRAVESALAFDPTARPSAGDLAAALLAACPALPIRGLVAVTPPPPRPATGRAPPPPRRAVVAVAAALLVVVTLGWVWGRGSAPQASVVRAADTPASDWTAVLAGLDHARSQAYAGADVALLTAVYVPGSESLRVDTTVLTGLARTRRTAVGVAHLVRSVTRVGGSGDRVELRVVEALTAHTVVDSRGRVVERHPAGPAATRVLVLARTESGWRVADVRQETGEGASQPAHSTR